MADNSVRPPLPFRLPSPARSPTPWGGTGTFTGTYTINRVASAGGAEQRPGNLLGNLLSTVAGILDPPAGGGGLGGLLNSIVALLNQILGQLGG